MNKRLAEIAWKTLNKKRTPAKQAEERTPTKLTEEKTLQTCITIAMLEYETEVWINMKTNMA